MMFGYRETFTYFQCNLCRCLQIAEMPQDMSRYYPQDYYSFSSRPLGSLKNPLEKAMRKLRDYHTVFNHGFWGRLISLTPNKKLIALSKVDRKSVV